MPVMYAAARLHHVYVDGTADLDDAVAIAVNAKVQRPGVCNAAETLLVRRRGRRLPAARAPRARPSRASSFGSMAAPARSMAATSSTSSAKATGNW